MSLIFFKVLSMSMVKLTPRKPKTWQTQTYNRNFYRVVKMPRLGDSGGPATVFQSCDWSLVL